MSLVCKNRWTASNATILAVAARNNGIFTAGGSGTLRLLDGIQTGVRDLDLDQIITKMEVEASCQGKYRNVAERIYLGCGPDGIACVEFGFTADAEGGSTQRPSESTSSLLAGEYSDMHFFSRRFI